MLGTNMLCELPALDYDYKEFAPYMSEEQLRVHHGKQHRMHVDGANKIITQLGRSRPKEPLVDSAIKVTLEELCFHISAHLLHSLFWGNLSPERTGGGKPNGRLTDALTKGFGDVERFKKEFAKAAIGKECSGWVALSYSRKNRRPVIVQFEKYDGRVCPMRSILMVIDVFDHAYQVDYKNDRVGFVKAFFHLLNWNAVNRRLEHLGRMRGRGNTGPHHKEGRRRCLQSGTARDNGSSRIKGE